jgi:hypothetical protein
MIMMIFWKNMNQDITVNSTYGDGPDVLVSGNSSVIILMEPINPNHVL